MNKYIFLSQYEYDKFTEYTKDQHGCSLEDYIGVGYEIMIYNSYAG